MNNPNPFIPQGSLLEQKNRTRSRVKLAVFCVVAINALGLMALLMQGCKREQTEAENQMPPVDTNVAPAVETNLPPMVESNPPPVPTPPPVVTPAPTPPPEAAGTEYVVVKGDTLAGIAKKNGVTLRALEAANPNVSPTRLRIGQKLVIPAGASPAAAGGATATTTDMGAGGNLYTVKAGDTLGKIAKAHGTTVNAIESENNLTTTKIKVGQKLKIPAAAAAAPAPTAAAPAPVVPAPAATPTPTGAPAGTPVGQ